MNLTDTTVGINPRFARSVLFEVLSGRLLCGRRKSLMVLASAAMMLFLVSGCMGAQSTFPDSGRLEPSSDGGPLSVVTTIPILADLARNVGGEMVVVRSLVSPGADVHSFQTTPKDSVVVAGASLLIANSPCTPFLPHPPLSSLYMHIHQSARGERLCIGTGGEILLCGWAERCV